MKLTYGTFCSGIEAPSVAWHPMGWEPRWFSEIDPHASAVLAHHHPNVPNLGDMTKIKGENLERVDLICAGTPCQSFSVAGLRKGMADPRGNLALVFLGLVGKERPRWVVWENVPGVLSSNGGRDFGSILGGLAELRYGFSYRVLDAQYIRVDGFGRAVPQRRRRVFVVGYLGDWRRAAAVLFERESLSGNPAPRREAGKRVAGTVKGGTGERGYPDPSDGNGGGLVELGISVCSGNGYWNPDEIAGPHRAEQTRASTANTLISIPEVCGALSDGAHMGGGRNGQDAYTGRIIPMPQRGRDGSAGLRAQAELSRCLNAGGMGRQDFETETLVVQGGVFSFHNRQDPDCSGEITHPIGAKDNGMAVAFAIQERAVSTGTSGPDGMGVKEEVSYTIEARNKVQGVGSGMCVRRLTPLECCRLQGFPDNYFDDVLYKGKHLADGPRYKMLGNSMAVNVMRWIGRRIEMVEAINQQKEQP